MCKENVSAVGDPEFCGTCEQNAAHSCHSVQNCQSWELLGGPRASAVICTSARLVLPGREPQKRSAGLRKVAFRRSLHPKAGEIKQFCRGFGNS
ncbi:Hypothetical predicted protein [Podarcis lilfordi]|uniref:Uncharacterized protein n=1 Tax=Podarcis lilfordi TaxID=74358 RepID=A0AA35PCH1_9SAUR|nr:Hypothetical predicted protein [Podarcis lilfordi]